ncbi:MAG: Secretion system C-terminal sorting domain [Bacteroidota bacterium]
MITKHFFLSLFVSFIHILTYSQSSDRKVYASAGRFVRNVNTNSTVQNTITYTLGEPLIYGATVGNFRLNNGFIQPDGMVSVSPNVVLLMKPADSFKLFPNPATSFSTIESSLDTFNTVKIQLIDLNGKLIKEETMTGLHHIVDLESAFIAPGTYYINFYSTEGLFLQQNKLIKSNTP